MMRENRCRSVQYEIVGWAEKRLDRNLRFKKWRISQRQILENGCGSVVGRQPERLQDVAVVEVAQTIGSV